MFKTYEDVANFIVEFESCRLPKSRWTHEAHLVAGFWYLNRHPFPEALDQVRERIKRHNASVGTENTDSTGYHETITRMYMTAIATHMAAHPTLGFGESLSALLASPLSNSEWPLGHYTHERLFSAEARHYWLEPDLRPIQ